MRSFDHAASASKEPAGSDDPTMSSAGLAHGCCGDPQRLVPAHCRDYIEETMNTVRGVTIDGDGGLIG
jgi:hypothetical protein